MSQSSAGSVPVYQVMQAAYAFALANWRRLIPAAVILGLLVGSGEYLMMISQAQGSSPEQSVPGFLAGLIIQVLAGTAYSACVLRLALRDEWIARLGLAFGADEFRLLGSALSVAFLVMPVILIAIMVLWSIALGPMIAAGGDPEAYATNPRGLFEAIAASLEPGHVAALVAVGGLALAVLLMIAARLAMVNAATIGERRIVVLQTWSWSRSNVLRILATLGWTLPPSIVAAILVQGLFNLGLEPGGEPNSLMVALLGAVSSTAQAIATLPTLAAGAELYRGLRPSGFVAR